MGLDFYVNRACPAQRELGAGGFLSHMQRRRRLQLLRPGAKVIVEGRELNVTLPAGSIAVMTSGASGTTHTLNQTDVAGFDAALARFVPTCATCPASPSGDPFGCYGFVSYPVEAETEVWLLGRIQAGGTDAAVAANLLRELGVTGERSAALRQCGREFFASPSPQKMLWSLADGSELAVTTDVACDLLLFQTPGDMLLVPIVCALLGLFPDGRGLREHPRAHATLVDGADLQRLVPSTPQQHAVAAYVRALVHAARGGFRIRADG